MATIKFRWTVDELANVMSLFTEQRVWRTDSLAAPITWTEITGPGTRVPLVEGQTSYYFDDTCGAAGMFYAVSYYNPGTTLESELSAPVRVDSIGYLTVEDVRDEGFTAAMVSDAQVARGIAAATAYIDRVTRRWFQPRSRTFRLDGNRGQDLLLNIPIIALTGLSIWEDAVDLGDVLVYNRHLTQGLLDPDDRDNPRIAWRDDVLTTRMRRNYHGIAGWNKGRGNIVVSGVFGYTELDPLATPAETTPGSQVPVSYGETPPLIKRACMLLAIRFMYPCASGTGEEFRVRARLVSESTADQSYSLGVAGVSDNSWGITGDIEVDNILMAYMAPPNAGVV